MRCFHFVILRALSKRKTRSIDFWILSATLLAVSVEARNASEAAASSLYWRGTSAMTAEMHCHVLSRRKPGCALATSDAWLKVLNNLRVCKMDARAWMARGRLLWSWNRTLPWKSSLMRCNLLKDRCQVFKKMLMRTIYITAIHGLSGLLTDLTREHWIMRCRRGEWTEIGRFPQAHSSWRRHGNPHLNGNSRMIFESTDLSSMKNLKWDHALRRKQRCDLYTNH